MIVLPLVAAGWLSAGVCAPPAPPDEIANSVAVPPTGGFGAPVDGFGNMIAPAGGLFLLGQGLGCCSSQSASRTRPDGVCEGNALGLDVVYRSSGIAVVRAPDEEVPEQFPFCSVIPAERSNFGEEACSCYFLTATAPIAVPEPELLFTLVEDEPVRWELDGCGGEFVDVDRVRLRVAPEVDKSSVALQVWMTARDTELVISDLAPVIPSLGLAALPVDANGDVVLSLQQGGSFDLHARLLRTTDGAISDIQSAQLTTLPLPPPPPPVLLPNGCASSDGSNLAPFAIFVIAVAPVGLHARREGTKPRGVTRST